MFHRDELDPPPQLAPRVDLESSDSDDETGIRAGEAGAAGAADADEALVQHINATIEGWEQRAQRVMKTHEAIDKFDPRYSNLIRIIMRERQLARRAQRRRGSMAERDDRVVWLTKIMVRKDLGDDSSEVREWMDPEMARGFTRKVLSPGKLDWHGKDPAAKDAAVGLLETCHPIKGFGFGMPLILWRNDRFKTFELRQHPYIKSDTRFGIINQNGLNQLMSEGRVYSGPDFTKWVKLEKNDTDMLLTQCDLKKHKEERMRDEFLSNGWLDFMEPAEFRTKYRVFKEYVPNDATMFDTDPISAARFFPRAGDAMDGPVMHAVTDEDDDDESDGDDDDESDGDDDDESDGDESDMQGGLKGKRKQSKRKQSKRKQSKRKQSKRKQSKRKQSKRKQSKRKQSKCKQSNRNQSKRKQSNKSH